MPPNHRNLVVNAPPPPQNPPFAQRLPALENHPGRPLEPQQVDNLRHGQPAGVMRDREVPAHQPPPPPRSSPPPAQHDSKPKR